MLTRHYYKSLCSTFYKENVNNFIIKNNKGETQTASGLSVYSNASSLWNTLKTYCKTSKYDGFNGGVAFGNGDTPVTIDDYQLSGEHFINFVGSVDCVINEDFTECTWTHTLTNSGSESFTIKEVGVYAGNSYTYYTVLIMREVLDSPVTIAPGGVGQVTFKFKINIPE